MRQGLQSRGQYGKFDMLHMRRALLTICREIMSSGFILKRPGNLRQRPPSCCASDTTTDCHVPQNHCFIAYVVHTSYFGSSHRHNPSLGASTAKDRRFTRQEKVTDTTDASLSFMIPLFCICICVPIPNHLSLQHFLRRRIAMAFLKTREV